MSACPPLFLLAMPLHRHPKAPGILAGLGRAVVLDGLDAAGRLYGWIVPEPGTPGTLLPDTAEREDPAGTNPFGNPGELPDLLYLGTIISKHARDLERGFVWRRDPKGAWATGDAAPFSSCGRNLSATRPPFGTDAAQGAFFVPPHTHPERDGVLSGFADGALLERPGLGGSVTLGLAFVGDSFHDRVRAQAEARLGYAAWLAARFPHLPGLRPGPIVWHDLP